MAPEIKNFEDAQQTGPEEQLFRPATIAEPVYGYEAVGDAEVTFYKDNGYLAVEHLFTPAEVDHYKAAFRDLIDGKVEGFTGLLGEGRARDLPEDQRADAIRKVVNFTAADKRLEALLWHPKLISIVERLIGAKAAKLQEMALLKPPRLGREKPWHQDHAYFPLSLDTPVVGCWIALDEATIANGCMQVLPDSREPVIHFKVRDWQICDTDMMGKQSVAVPLKPGGCLFFSSLLKHGTPSNHSSDRRWAVQLHYYPEGTEPIAQEKRMEVFGSEGKDVTC